MSLFHCGQEMVSMRGENAIKVITHFRETINSKGRYVCSKNQESLGLEPCLDLGIEIKRDDSVNQVK